MSLVAVGCWLLYLLPICFEFILIWFAGCSLVHCIRFGIFWRLAVFGFSFAAYLKAYSHWIDGNFRVCLFIVATKWLRSFIRMLSFLQSLGFFFLLFSFFQHKLRSKQICVVFIAFYVCCIKTSTNAFRLLENNFRFAIVCLFVWLSKKRSFFLSQLTKTSSKCGQWKVFNPKSVFVSIHLNSLAFAWNISNIRNIEVDKWIRF